MSSRSAKEDKEAERRRQRQFKSSPSILLLVGLPGSGKSHFAHMLAQSNEKWVYVSQDELRSRSLCEKKFSEAALASPRTGVKVILDRCNPDPAERAQWLDLALRPKSIAAVFFDSPVQACRERMKARTNHPTIPFGSGDVALDSFVKKLVPPVKEEGFVSVRVVRTFEDSDKLLREFGADPDLLRQREVPVEPDLAVTPALKDFVIMDEEEEPSPSSSSSLSSWSSPAPQKPSQNGDASSSSSSQRLPVARPAVTKPTPSTSAAKKPPQNGKKGKSKDQGNSESDDEPTEDGYFKFPRTRHIVDMGSATRDDLLFTPQEAKVFFSKGQVISVEEKVDGANMGISISSNFEIKTQNRAHFVNSSTHKQFGQLDAWIEEHRGALFEILEPGRHILFGEWLYARHSVFYSRLPGYFLAFDIYDKLEGKFLSREARTRRLEGTGIPTVPVIHHGPVGSQEELLSFLERPSQFADGAIEGIYCRIDDGDHLRLRGKIVRSEFLQQIEQPWTHQSFVKNKISYAYEE